MHNEILDFKVEGQLQYYNGEFFAVTVEQYWLKLLHDDELTFEDMNCSIEVGFTAIDGNLNEVNTWFVRFLS